NGFVSCDQKFLSPSDPFLLDILYWCCIQDFLEGSMQMIRAAMTKLGKSIQCQALTIIVIDIMCNHINPFIFWQPLSGRFTSFTRTVTCREGLICGLKYIIVVLLRWS